MKYIKLFESHNIDIQIETHLKEEIFNNLPLNFKKGFLTWQYEGDNVEWSYDEEINDWVNDPNVNILIDDYSKERGNQKCKYGYVPTKLIIDKLTPIMIDEYGYSSFDEWHNAYQSTNDANHGDSQFPIIIGDEGDEEWLWDGWHRFNYYLSKKMENIPVIKI